VQSGSLVQRQRKTLKNGLERMR